MPERALIIAPSWVGDAVMSQVLLMRLKKAHKDLRIDVLAPRAVAQLYTRMAQVDEVFECHFAHGELDLKGRYHWGERLRANNYDAAFVLPNSFKSALVPWFARIPLRVGYTGEARFVLLNHRFFLDEIALPKMAKRFFHLGEAFNKRGAHFDVPMDFPHLTAHDPAPLLKKFSLNMPPAGVVIFCPGAEFGPAKRWPSEYFAELAKRLLPLNLAIWVIGTNKDAQAARIITEIAPNAVNLCGKTELIDAIDLIAITRAVVCNDSGLMHVASALNRPLVAIYGSSSPDFTPPLNNKAKIIRLNLACSPCFKRKCPLQHLNCLQQITPEQIFKTLQKMLH